MNKIKACIKIFIVCVLSALLFSCGVEESKIEDFQFEYCGQNVSVGDDVALILSELGEPVSYAESPSCAFEGLDKIYRYGSFEILTYPCEDKDCIAQIRFLNDLISTSEGIKIGSSRAEVITSYGEDFTVLGSGIVYKGKNSILQFAFRDDRVTAISYKENDD